VDDGVGSPLYTLRVVPETLSGDGFVVGLELFAGDDLQERDKVVVAYTLTPQDLEDLRWYLEDFPAFPLKSAAQVAELIERRSIDAGISIFRALFASTPNGQRIWSAVAPELNNTRIEVILNTPSADSFPWELAREREGSPPVAVLAKAFVRWYSGLPSPSCPQSTGAIRVLVVICRPGGQDDVPFRSVAGRLLAASDIATELAFQVLRPPSFAHLCAALHEAHVASQPFQIVHFDGHGTFEDLFGWSQSASARNKRGYLVFEDPSASDNRELVHGTKLGRELASNGVRLLVMNACRSAHVGAIRLPTTPEGAPAESLRVYGSLANEIVKAGVPGVVAMRHNVWVDTAARFMTKMYAGLAEFDSVGESVRHARASLFFDSFREHAGRSIQDWQVPVVYEQSPIRIINSASSLVRERRNPAHATEYTVGLPPTPSIGFAGHDATILAADRAFDSHSVVLLVGAAGSGKTSVLAEFGRWMALSGGSASPVLYTPFRKCRSIEDLIDSAIASIGAPAANWPRMNFRAKQSALLSYLSQNPSFWLWDEVDLVTGSLLNRGAPWSAEDKSELRQILQEVCTTPSKLLLSSRAYENGLIGAETAQIDLPPLAMSDRYELLRRLVAHRHRSIADLAAWEPLLDLSEGNDLALIAFAECALNEGAESRESILALLNRICDGSVTCTGQLAVEEVRAIDAELSAVLKHFTRIDQARLALLALFRSYFTETTLRYMGRTDCSWSLEEVGDISPIELMSLLSKFAQTGLLRPLAGGYFIPHPLLPILMRRRLDSIYGSDICRPLRAFVDVIGTMCTYMVRQYNRGQEVSAEASELERPNLLYALHLAFENHWWESVISIMQGLRLSWKGKGRWQEWSALVDFITPQFALPESEGPIPGREEDWVLVMDYRIETAASRNDFADAERLEVARGRFLRQLVAEVTALHDRDLEKYRAQWLARSLQSLGSMRARRGNVACLAAYEEAFHLMMLLGLRRDAGLCARDLVLAYGSHEAYSDPDKCEIWIKRTIELIPDDPETMALLQTMRSRHKAHRAIENLELALELGEQPLTGPSEGNRGSIDESIQEFMNHQEMMADELPLPPITKPSLRMVALRTRAAVRLDRGDDRGLTDYLEALQIAVDLNDLLSRAEIELELASGLLDTERREQAEIYVNAALEHFGQAGEPGVLGAEKARELQERIDNHSDDKG
jgi:CHAT domain-containing protein